MEKKYLMHLVGRDWCDYFALADTTSIFEKLDGYVEDSECAYGKRGRNQRQRYVPWLN